MIPAALATDTDRWGDFTLVSTPGSLNWKHGTGRVSHAGLGRTRQYAHPPCMHREQVTSAFCTCHPQTNAQH